MQRLSNALERKKKHHVLQVRSRCNGAHTLNSGSPYLGIPPPQPKPLWQALCCAGDAMRRQRNMPLQIRLSWQDQCSTCDATTVTTATCNCAILFCSMNCDIRSLRATAGASSVALTANCANSASPIPTFSIRIGMTIMTYAATHSTYALQMHALNIRRTTHLYDNSLCTYQVQLLHS